MVTTLKVDDKSIEELKKSYEKFGRGRREVEATLAHRGSDKVLAKFKGEFVVLKKSDR